MMTTQEMALGRFGDRRAFVVWFVLVGATVVSYLVGAESAIDNRNVVAALVIGVSFLKVRLVAIHFMELGHAPPALRVLIEAYCAVMPLVLFALYLAA